MTNSIFPVPAAPLCLTLLLHCMTCAQAPALRGLDPVLLGRGEEHVGSAELSATHGGYTYHFASAADRATFLADPERHGIQWGGACARMGPLSGTGDADRWLVHEGRIYVFASDQCRDGFARDPGRFLAKDDEPPTGTDAAVARGQELLAAAIRGVGGETRLRAWRTYRHERSATNGDTRQDWRLQVQLPTTVRADHDWFSGDKSWRYHRVLSATDNFFVDTGTARAMHSAAQREARQELLREPAFALRAALEGKPVVVALGTRTMFDLQVEEFSLWLDGCATIFGVDANGVVRTARYRGRGPSLWFGEVTKLFDDHQVVDGLKLPGAIRGTFDGKEATGLTEQRRALQVDFSPPADAFVRPR